MSLEPIESKFSEEKLKKAEKEEKKFREEVKELRRIYKRYKVGLVVWKDIPPSKQVLLNRYYGVKRKVVWRG